MDFSSITFSFFLIFTGAAVFASLALYTRQPLIIAYIALGACIGPYGLSLVTDLDLLTDIGHVGIIFLLFLLGLDMQPQALWVTLRKSVVVAVFSSCIFHDRSTPSPHRRTDDWSLIVAGSSGHYCTYGFTEC